MQFAILLTKPDRGVYRDKLKLTPQSPPTAFTILGSHVELLSFESAERFDPHTGAFCHAVIRFYTKLHTPQDALAVSSWISPLLDSGAKAKVTNSPWFHTADEILSYIVDQLPSNEPK